ncbi:MAG: hypothetical protein WBD47_11465, partial [Phormidesmis sp.]
AEAIDIARQIQNVNDRAIALAKLATKTDGLLPEALAAVREIKDEDYRASALSAMAPHLPSEVMPEASKIIWSIQDKYFCANALQSFLPALEQLSIPFPEWVRVLDILAYRNRADLLEALPDSRATLTRLGDSITLPAVLQAMRDVCQQWP